MYMYTVCIYMYMYIYIYIINYPIELVRGYEEPFYFGRDGRRRRAGDKRVIKRVIKHNQMIIYRIG